MKEGRTFQQLLGGREDHTRVQELRISGGPGLAQPGAQPLGGDTGAPPWTRFTTVQVIPASAAGTQAPTCIVDRDRASREIVITAPVVGFSIWIGDSGVGVGKGVALTPGLPYFTTLVGGQDLYAVTDAPVYLPVRVQVAALLIGDRERAYR